MQQRGLPLGRHLRVGIQGLLEQEIGVAAEQDVSPAARHVRRDGDGAFAAGLGDDLGFLLVMLGVQDVVLDAVPDEIASQPFRLLDRDGAHQDRLSPLVAVHDLVHDRVELLLLGAVHHVREVRPDEGPIGGDDDHVQIVDLGELAGLGVGRSRHAGELVIHPEQVLEGD